MFIGMVVMGIIFVLPFVFFGSIDYISAKEERKKFWSKNKYVEISPSAAMEAIRAGVNFYSEYNYGDVWYFYKPKNSSVSFGSYNEKIYIKWNSRDEKLFENMYTKYQNEKENEKIFKNNSEDGYNYLIQAVEKHRNDCAKMAQQAMDDATEVYVNSYKSLYNSVKY